MDWNEAIQAERAALTRIVALLLAFADLAERSSTRSQTARGFVLWLLRRAEAIARDLVTGTPAPIPLCPVRNSPADAIRLARNFRNLARELDRQSALAFAVDDTGDNAWDSLLFRGETAAVETSHKRKKKPTPGVARDRFDALALHPAPDTS